MPLFLLLSASIHSLSRCCAEGFMDSHWNLTATIWDQHDWIHFIAEKHRLGAAWTEGSMAWHATDPGWDLACMLFSWVFLLPWSFNSFICNTDNVSPLQRYSRVTRSQCLVLRRSSSWSQSTRLLGTRKGQQRENPSQASETKTGILRAPLKPYLGGSKWYSKGLAWWLNRSRLEKSEARLYTWELRKASA